jgi:parvulin-like peptidyl-prolyl isomerase
MQYRKFYEDYGQKPAVQDERNYKADAMLMLFEETLNSWIVLHTMYLDMTLSVPPEQMDEFKKSLAKDFDSRVLPKVMEQFGVTNRYELNEELRKFGTTLERKKENFLLQNLAEGWFHQRVKPPNQVLNYDDMVSYYEQHKDEKYKVLGTVKWEELAALFPENASEEDAYAKIAALGNRVVQGEPFAEVARQGSQGLSAYRGGERETTVGSLRTPNLEKAVFSLPVGSMSTIIREDMGGINAGYYIVRVLERKDTHYIPFDRVQGEIEKVINGERMKREQERMLAEICNRYPVVKTNNLQQIIHIASEAERNLPVVDTPEYHTQLIAKAERLAPTKKNSANRHTQPSSLQQEPQHIQQQNQEAPRVAWGTNRSDTQNTALPPSWEPNLEPTSRNDDPPKKKTLWQSLNPFR